MCHHQIQIAFPDKQLPVRICPVKSASFHCMTYLLPLKALQARRLTATTVNTKLISWCMLRRYKFDQYYLNSNLLFEARSSIIQFWSLPVNVLNCTFKEIRCLFQDCYQLN